MLSCVLLIIIAAIVEVRKAIVCVCVWCLKGGRVSFVGVNYKGLGERSVKLGDGIPSWNLENEVTCSQDSGMPSGPPKLLTAEWGAW